MAGLDAYSQSRRRRARLACLRCHEKKVKCDVQIQSGAGIKACTPCRVLDFDCRLRSRKVYVRQTRQGQEDNRAQAEGAAEEGLDNASDVLPSQEISTWPVGNLQSIEAENADSVFPRLNDASQLSTELGSRQGEIAPATATASVAEAGHRGAQSTSSATAVNQDPRDPTATVTARQAKSLSQPSHVETGGHGSMSIDQSMHRDKLQRQPPISNINPTLRRIYFETYLEYAYSWCPILDRDVIQAHPEFANSILLNHSLAIIGSNIKPPFLHHTPPFEHYQMARYAFYHNNETNKLVAICAVALFHYWDTNSMNTVNSTDAQWWWLGNAIRLAQDLSLHREGKPSEQHGPFQALKRRLWWTLFARERVTAICQGRPCVIDPEYCNVPMPVLEDFPTDSRHKATIFIQHVRLCDILGRLSRLFAQGAVSSPSTLHVRNELIAWAQNLPANLQLPFADGVIENYDRDVLLLHIPYLGAITMLYLSFSSDAPPKASAPGIVAASITARICEELLARGSVRFMHEETVWFIGFAILAVTHARWLDCLAPHADADIQVLRTALKQMASMWHSAREFQGLFDKTLPQLETSCTSPLARTLADQHQCTSAHNGTPDADSRCPLPTCLRELAAMDGVDWLDYFPYGNCRTTPLFGAILKVRWDSVDLPALDPPVEFSPSMHALFANLEELYGDLFSVE